MMEGCVPIVISGVCAGLSPVGVEELDDLDVTVESGAVKRRRPVVFHRVLSTNLGQ